MWIHRSRRHTQEAESPRFKCRKPNGWNIATKSVSETLGDFRTVKVDGLHDKSTADPLIQAPSNYSTTGTHCLLSHLKASIIIHVSLSSRKKDTKSFGGTWQTTAYIFVSFGFILIRKVGSQNVSGWIWKHLNIDRFCPEFRLTLDCSVAYPLTKQSVPSNRNNKHNVNEILTDS